MSKKENLELMAQHRENILKLIEKYNLLAEEQNFETRIGLIDATYDVYDKKYELACEINETGEEPSEELIDSMEVDINSLINNYESPYWSTNFPGVKKYCWKPSGINC